MLKMKFKYFSLIVLLLSVDLSFGQTFLPISDAFQSGKTVTVYGSGYLSPALLTRDFLDPAIKLTMAIEPFRHFNSYLSYTRSPGFEETSSVSIHTKAIVFPNKNQNSYSLQLSSPFVIKEKKRTNHSYRVVVAPFSETIYINPQSSNLNAYSLPDEKLQYKSVYVHLGALASWEYYSRVNRYGLHGGLYYYRINIFDASGESFRNMFGDPYLPTAFQGIGGNIVTQINDFSFSIALKQNLELIDPSIGPSVVNDNASVRKLSEIESLNWDFQIGWSGELLSFSRN